MHNGREGQTHGDAWMHNEPWQDLRKRMDHVRRSVPLPIDRNERRELYEVQRVAERGVARKMHQKVLKPPLCPPDPTKFTEREKVLAAVQLDGLVLETVPREYCSDREVVRTAVMQEAKALRFASEDLRADKQIVLAAVTSDPNKLGVMPVVAIISAH